MKVSLSFQRDKRSSDAAMNSTIFCCRVVPYGRDGRSVDRDHLHGPDGYFFFACARAEPAADLDAALVRPSLRTAEAAVAAFADVTFDGATCASELPAALFDALPVDPLERTVDDLVATLGLVTFVAIARPQNYWTHIQYQQIGRTAMACIRWRFGSAQLDAVVMCGCRWCPELATSASCQRRVGLGRLKVFP